MTALGSVLQKFLFAVAGGAVLIAGFLIWVNATRSTWVDKLKGW